MASSVVTESIPVLYSYWRSSCSWRVRTALALKGIKYEYKAVHLVKNEQGDSDYAKLNPMKQVPTLIIDGLTLTQSVAIQEYLEETRPEGAKLLPQDAGERAIVRMLTEAINSGIQPIQNLPVLQYMGEKKVEFAKHFITRGLRFFEKMLAIHSGKYCFKDAITMADTALVPQVYNAKRFNVDMSEFPIISRINEELLKHPAFIAAHPSQQPDCPE